MRLKFPSINKQAHNSEGQWREGPDVAIASSAIVAVEPKKHGYHSFRPEQDYSVLHLANGGGTIEVFMTSDQVEAMLVEATAK